MILQQRSGIDHPLEPDGAWILQEIANAAEAVKHPAHKATRLRTSYISEEDFGLRERAEVAGSQRNRFASRIGWC